MQRILIMGATSAIAEAAARQFAARGDALFLVARNLPTLQAVAADLRMRGAAQIETAVLDACELDGLPKLVPLASHALGGLDQALIAHGSLPDQVTVATLPQQLCEALTVNAVSVMALAQTLGGHFESQGHGVIAVISSVAGDRGRSSNYLYGAAKAAVTAFLSGLRQRLHAKGVVVITIKPGFVDTPMTSNFRKGALWASSARVARDIVRAMDRGTPVIYTPWFWRPIMWVVRAIPEFIFQRLQI
jgi:short-subunit dehydrogenase